MKAKPGEARGLTPLSTRCPAASGSWGCSRGGSACGGARAVRARERVALGPARARPGAPRTFADTRMCSSRPSGHPWARRSATSWLSSSTSPSGRIPGRGSRGRGNLRLRLALGSSRSSTSRYSRLRRLEATRVRRSRRPRGDNNGLNVRDVLGGPNCVRGRSDGCDVHAEIIPRETV